MLKNTRNSAKWMTIVGAMLLPLAGCSDKANNKPDNSAGINHFEDPHKFIEAADVTRLMHVQAESGARNDATLYADHFDGTGLSSLGIEKLDQMLADSHACNPLVVYLAIPSDTLADQRRITVNNYLQDKGGLKADQVQFQDGPNPDTYNPTAPNLKNYSKTETTETGSSDTSGGSSSAASSGSSSGGYGGSSSPAQ